MNDIEILEEFIPLLEDGYVDNKDCTKEIQAIENLIKENKKLKEKAKNTMGLIGANYIHKDKVKEKIKELDKKMAEDEVDEFGIHSQGWVALDWTRDFLLELL